MTRTVPGHVDSVGKILERLQLVSPYEVTYKGKPVRAVPSEFYASPALMRYFECKTGCTACCLPFTLDFTNDEFNILPEEVAGNNIDELFYERVIEVNGSEFRIQSYDQYKDDACPFLVPNRNKTALGCAFWAREGHPDTGMPGPGQPIECEAAPQLLMTSRGPDISMLTSRPFGRGWAWKDKPQCIFHPVADRIQAIPDDAQEQCASRVRTLRRYLTWAEYLEIETVLPQAIEAVENLPATLRDNGMRTVQYA